MAGPVHDVAFDGTTYVRVSLLGLIQTSTNAIDWTNRTSGVSVDLWGADFGNSTFVVTGDGGTVLTSTDGITWVDRSAASSTTEDLYSVTFSDIFLACGTNGVIISSTVTGDAWSGLDSGTAEDLWDISSEAGTYEAVGDNDVIVVGDIITSALSATLIEDVDLALADAAIGTFNHTVTDDTIMRERAIHDEEDLTFFEVISENMLLSQGGSGDNIVGNEVVPETLNMFQRLFINNEVISDGVLLADTIIGGWLFNLADDFTVDETAPTYKYTAADHFFEQIDFNDIITGSLIIGATIAEDIDVTEDLLSSATLAQVLTDGTAFSALVSTSLLTTGDETDESLWTAWVVNTRNLGVSEYERYNFTSFTLYNGTYYGANDQGIYYLEGDFDDGWLIKALVKTGLIDFDNEFQKKIPRMYLGLRNDGSMVLKTITNENVERWYILRKNQSGLGKGRLKVVKGVKSAYWQFEIANVSGCDFDINSMELMPIVLSRRIK